MENKSFRKLIIYFISLFVLFFHPLAYGADNATVENKDTQITTDLNKPIVIDNKQWTITIKLPANATTGYQWYLKDFNSQILRPKSYHYSLENKTDAKLAGQGGYAEFKLTISKRFKTIPQLTQLTFIYARPWNLSDQSKTQVITLLSQGNTN